MTCEKCKKSVDYENENYVVYHTVCTTSERRSLPSDELEPLNPATNIPTAQK